MNAAELVFSTGPVGGRQWWFALDGYQFGPFLNRSAAERAAFLEIR